MSFLNRIVSRKTIRTTLTRGLVFTVILMTVVSSAPNVFASTYTFTQTDWSGGASSSTASHAANQTGWASYASESGGVRALEFDGATGYVSIPQTDLQLGASLSLEAWVKASDLSGTRGIISKMNVPWSDLGYDLKVVDGHLRFYVMNSSWEDVISPSALNINQWYHVVGSIDSADNVAILYIDGSEVARRTLIDHWVYYGTGEPVLIGASRQGAVSEFWSGSIDDARIYDRALTAGEVAAHFADTGASTSGVAEGNLLSGYAFDESEGLVATDWSGNNHHATVVGGVQRIAGFVPNASLDTMILSTDVQTKLIPSTFYTTDTAPLSSGFLTGTSLSGLGRNASVRLESSLSEKHIYAGGTSAFGVAEQGQVLWAWGSNGSYVVENSGNATLHAPTNTPNANGWFSSFTTTVQKVATNGLHTLVLGGDGQIYSFGQNNYGQLGVGGSPSDIPRTTYSYVIDPSGTGNFSDVVDIAVGDTHSLAVKADGTVWAWGNDTDGQLGDGSTLSKAYPVQVRGFNGVGFLTDVVAVTGGTSFSAALKADGTVWAWGYSEFGQAGDGSSARNRYTPVQVKDATGDGVLSGITAIESKAYSVMALHTDGTVWTWGYNANGELGAGPSFASALSLLPVNVVSSTGAGTLSGVTAIAIGDYHALALKADGTVWTWGANDFGQLGHGITSGTRVVSPKQVRNATGTGFLTDITEIAAGSYSTLATQSDGSVFSWGNNDVRQLGRETSESFSALPGLVPDQGITNDLTGITHVDAGWSFGFAQKNDNTLWTWGRIAESIEDNYPRGRAHYAQQLVDFNGDPITSADTAQIAASDSAYYIVKTDGTVWAFGYNGTGELGNGTLEKPATLTQVIGQDGVGFLTDVIEVRSNYESVVALKSDGTVWTWGSNREGQLGYGPFGGEFSTTTPVQVVGQDGIGYLSDIIQVEDSGDTHIALKSDGTVWLWGSNDNGELAQGVVDNALSTSTPVQAIGLPTITKIAAGGWDSVYALDTLGQVWAWGEGRYAQLGRGSLLNSGTPARVQCDYWVYPCGLGYGGSGYLSGIDSITANEDIGMAYKNDLSEVYRWGTNRNSAMLLGYPDTQNYLEAVPVSNSLGEIITAGDYGVLYVVSGGTLLAGGKDTGNGFIPDGVDSADRYQLVYAKTFTPTGNYLNLGSTSFINTGSYESPLFDIPLNAGLKTFNYNSNIPTGTALTVSLNLISDSNQVQTTFVPLASGSDLSFVEALAPSSSFNKAQIVVEFSSEAPGFSPTFSNPTITYDAYAGDQYVVSSPYNSEDPLNTLAGVRWTQAVAGSSQVKFQLRTAADDAGAPGEWTVWMGPDGTNESYFTDPTGSESAANTISDLVDDQWFQYKAFLVSDGGNQPVLEDVSVVYVTNKAPEIGSVIAAQISEPTDPDLGKVSISYAVRDEDAMVGSQSAGFITPTFYYSIDETTWNAIDPATLTPGSTDDKAVSEVSFAPYQVMWDAKTQLGDFSSAAIIVQVRATDNELTNNATTSEGASFALDLSAPTIHDFTYSGDYYTRNSLPLRLRVNASDSNNFTYRYSNNADLTPDGVNATTGIMLDGSVYGDLDEINYITSSPATFSSIYYEFIDAFGNATSSSIVIPPAPSKFNFRDTSNPDNSDYQITLSWDPYVSGSPIPFYAYYLFRSTDNETFERIWGSSPRQDPSINTYTDTGLDPTATYYYRVLTWLDSEFEAAVSNYSATLSDIPNGQGGTDLIAPLVSGVAVSEAQITWAKIGWSTDELSNSVVEYGPSSAGLYTASTTELGMVTNHSVVISGLEPETEYMFRVISSDAIGNRSVDDNNGSGYLFTTAAGPKIADVTTVNVSSQGATIFWNTNKDSNSYVYYSLNADLSASMEINNVDLVAGGATSTGVYQHRLDLSGLEPGTVYYYYVKSVDAFGNIAIEKNTAPYYSFKTTQDQQPPVITGVNTPVISATALVISWKTDEPSTSQVDYGSSTEEYSTSTALDTVFSTYHVVSITGLNPLTTYYYRVRSKDDANNEAISPQLTFKTSKDVEIKIVTIGGGSAATAGVKADTTAPKITSIAVASTTAFASTITFETDEATTGYAAYGKTNEYGSEASDSEFSKTHTITIPNLKLGTEYNFKVKAIDKSGNAASSANQTFKTKFLAEDLANLATLENASQFQEEIEQSIESILPSIVPPFIETPIVSDITEESATISWKTNTRGYSIVSYAPEPAYDATKVNPYTAEASNMQSKGTSHSILLTGLKPNTTYHYSAKSFSLPGAIGSSKDFSFTTKASRTQASVFDIKNTSFRVTWVTEEPASTVVEYTNIKTGITERIIDNARASTHEVIVEHLVPAARYSVTVFGYTEKGNIIESGAPISVLTSQDVVAPRISNFKVDGALVPGRTDRIQTIVSWTTDEPASGVVEYQEGSGSVKNDFANKVTVADSYVTNHVVILTNLKPGTIYQFKITSADQGGNTASFGPRTIITPQKGESIFDVIFKNFEDTFKFLRSAGQ